jgi:hypothetical protein
VAVFLYILWVYLGKKGGASTMVIVPPTHQRWNIFARILEDLLHERGLGLGLVDDRAGVHREKVRRLKQSLIVPKSFPVLNPEEMEQVVVAFQFTEHEVHRLRAAILATAIEETLMERIAPIDALIAAEQVFGVILQAFYRHAGEKSGLAVTRKSREQSDNADELLEPALHAIDRGTIAIHLSQSAESDLEQVEYAHRALTDFQLALNLLSSISEHLMLTEAWQVWQHEAQKGITIAQQRLEALGEY